MSVMFEEGLWNYLDRVVYSEFDINLLFWCCMSRGNREPLRFDTSLANITCFIRGKSHPADDPRASRPRRKRPEKAI